MHWRRLRWTIGQSDPVRLQAASVRRVGEHGGSWLPSSSYDRWTLVNIDHIQLSPHKGDIPTPNEFLSQFKYLRNRSSQPHALFVQIK